MIEILIACKNVSSEIKILYFAQVFNRNATKVKGCLFLKTSL